jgi:hypothetical protein
MCNNVTQKYTNYTTHTHTHTHTYIYIYIYMDLNDKLHALESMRIEPNWDNKINWKLYGLQTNQAFITNRICCKRA